MSTYIITAIIRAVNVFADDNLALPEMRAKMIRHFLSVDNYNRACDYVNALLWAR